MCVHGSWTSGSNCLGMCGENPSVLWFLSVSPCPRSLRWLEYPSRAADAGDALSIFWAFTACGSKMELMILASSESNVCYFRDFLGKRFLCFIRLVLSPFKLSLSLSFWPTVILPPAESGEGEQKGPWSRIGLHSWPSPVDMLHLLFLFPSCTERCGWQCVSWVNLWKLSVYFMEETWSILESVLSVFERDPGAHYLQGWCRRICYGWLLEDWHWFPL